METHNHHRRLLGFGLGFGLTSTLSPSWATLPATRTHALLIGVGTVAALTPSLWLDGPARDVRLLRQSLLAAGLLEREIQALSTAPGESAPSYTAVHKAMSRVLTSARRGDRVLFHFSGHGAQIPASQHRALTESDGLDEVMLLSDVLPWRGNATTGYLPNALTDTSLSAWLDQLAAKGVYCWVFLDCCHAAGLMRESSALLKAGDIHRAVTAADLGVPLPTWREAQRSKGLELEASSGRAGKGTWPPPLPLQRRVFACAAMAQSSAVECQLPDPQDGRLRTFGLLTHTLSSLIRAEAFDSASTLSTALRQHPSIVQRHGPWPVVVGDDRMRWLSARQGAPSV